MNSLSSCRKPLLIERRPLMLKDFLRDDFSSCSSSGFRSFPRRTCCITVRNILEFDVKVRDFNSDKKSNLLRNRSKATSALQKASQAMINVVKRISFSVKSPSQRKNQQKQRILQKSISRKLFKRKFWKKDVESEGRIRITTISEEIKRERSFRYSVEKNQIAAIAIPASNSNSWSDSDVTSDYSHSLSGRSEYSGEKYSPEKKISKRKGDTIASTTYSVENKGQSIKEEKEQFSPVSILDFPYEEEEETPSSFQQSLAAMEKKKKKLMHKIRRFENLASLEPIDLEKRIASMELDDNSQESTGDYNSISGNSNEFEEVNDEEIKAEEKARELLNLLKDKKSFVDYCKSNLDNVFLDYFRDEIMGSNVRDGDELELKLFRVTRNLINGLDEVVDKSEMIVREMERREKWRKFEEEEEKIVMEMERDVLGSLMEELLLDIYNV